MRIIHILTTISLVSVGCRTTQNTASDADVKSSSSRDCQMGDNPGAQIEICRILSPSNERDVAFEIFYNGFLLRQMPADFTHVILFRGRTYEKTFRFQSHRSNELILTNSLSFMPIKGDGKEYLAIPELARGAVDLQFAVGNRSTNTWDNNGYLSSTNGPKNYHFHFNAVAP